MKGDTRPRMLLYLLMGALLLSTILNFYFLLRLDASLADEEMAMEQVERDQGKASLSASVRRPSAANTAPDSVLKPGH